MKILCTIGIFLLLLTSLSNAQWQQTGAAVDTIITQFAVLNSTLFAATSTNYNNAQILASTDNGTTWHLAKTGLGRVMDAFAVNGNDLFLSLDDAGVYLSTDNGTTWSQTNSTVEPYTYSFAVLNSKLFAGTWYQGVYVTSDTGASWTRKDSGLTNLNVNVLLANGSNLFAGTSGSGVYLSTNEGISWTGVSSGIQAYYGYIDAMAAIGSTIFAGTATIGVYKSTNNGTNWTTARAGLPQNNVPYYKIAALVSSGNNLFAGTGGGGVYLSTNFGTSWSSVNQGLIGMNIKALAIKDGYLFAGGDTGGVWRRPLTDMTGVSDNTVGLPVRASLSQNYPNPFNPSTTIHYQLPTESRVTLRVYNLFGQVVKVLTDVRQQAGDREVTWNAAGSASGIYFYRLDVTSLTGPNTSFTDVKSMILVK